MYIYSNIVDKNITPFVGKWIIHKLPWFSSLIIYDFFGYQLHSQYLSKIILTTLCNYLLQFQFFWVYSTYTSREQPSCRGYKTYCNKLASVILHFTLYSINMLNTRKSDSELIELWFTQDPELPKFFNKTIVEGNERITLTIKRYPKYDKHYFDINTSNTDGSISIRHQEWAIARRNMWRYIY